MSAARKLHAVWRGVLAFEAVTCPVALYSAASTEERVSFRTLNRQTGHPIQRTYIDAETGEPVERDEQVRGYEASPGDYIVLTPDDISAAVPASDKVLKLTAFIKCADVDTLYLDKPYFLAPGDQPSAEIFQLIYEGLKETDCAAVVQSVLFRRVRSLLVYVHDGTLRAATLNYDYEVLPAAAAFDEIPESRTKGELLDLAKHIIQTKKGEFDPEAYRDRYDTALAELVKAKIEGREVELPPPVKPSNVVDLLSALRESAGQRPAKRNPAATARRAKAPSKRRTSG